VRSLWKRTGRLTQGLVSITDRRTIFQLAWEVDGIIHVASLDQLHIATCSEQVFIETNVLGTLTLLEAAAQVGIRRFVYASSTLLHGQAIVSHRQAVWVTEDLVPRPRDIYDRTKIIAEHLCWRFALSIGLPDSVTRIQGHSSPLQDESGA
jgi:UDP-glucose 4-epimerase